MSDELGTAAKEAIRIADKFLAGRPVRDRKALAQEIVAAISLCEKEIGDLIVSTLETIKH
jgi:hypothetical protein